MARKILMIFIVFMATLPITVFGQETPQESPQPEIIFDGEIYDYRFHGFFEVNGMLWLNGSRDHQDHWYDLSTGEFFPTGMPELRWNYTFSIIDLEFAYEHYDGDLHNVILVNMTTLEWDYVGNQSLSVSRPQFIGEQLWVHLRENDTLSLCRVDDLNQLTECELQAEGINHVVVSEQGRAYVGINILPNYMTGEEIPELLPKIIYPDTMEEIPSGAIYTVMNNGRILAAILQPAKVLQIVVETNLGEILVYDGVTSDRPYSIPQPQWAGNTLFWNWSEAIFTQPTLMTIWEQQLAGESFPDGDLRSIYYPIAANMEGGSFIWNQDHTLWTASYMGASYVYNPVEQTITQLFEGELPEFDGDSVLTQSGQQILRFDVFEMEFEARADSGMFYTIPE